MPEIAASSVPWISVDQMREVDRVMIEELEISLVQMMENAGRSLAFTARRLLDRDIGGTHIIVLAGPGGNGGGGLVAARHLATAGAHPEVRLSAAPDQLTPVPRHQCRILSRMGVPIEVGGEELAEPDLVVDALLGYSQEGEPRGEMAELIRRTAHLRTLSLDTPSGLELSSGELRSPFVEAEATLTLALPKEGLRSAAAERAVGDLYLADISVPASVYDRLGLDYRSPFGAGPIVRIEPGS